MAKLVFSEEGYFKFQEERLAMGRDGLKAGSFMFFKHFDQPVEDTAEALLVGSGALDCVPSAQPAASVLL